MMDSFIDTFFSFRGGISRRTWLAGLAALAIASVIGVVLFNDDSFDESANAVSGAPTMAAFLWALLCLFALSALSAKRLNAAGASPLALASIVGPSVSLIAGWGLGYFQAPLAMNAETAAFWMLLALPLPALLLCLRQDSARSA